ncbi:PREDICTED: FERM domain-containing protein 5 isoform X2 [Papilio polytes]|uniref:FERM domain-containing protein 5 isoform X2 n=1 Tax=Papilio polytes TaxID=76194 RepID=UPI0006761ED8|nr:PREDICTED: FERM domain-containing protein 5 isoform X2 [Papilio polytes]
MFKSRGDSNIVYKCTVRLLEDTEILECEFHPGYKGKYLLEHVCQQLNLAETDYFGLRYVDSAGQRHWLHIAKLILKQVKDSSPILFSFRVKFYPPNPLLLKEDVTRFQIYLQLKRDLLHGRLYCTANEAAMLGALIIQIELGDYDPSIHVGNYVTEMRLLLRQTDAIEARIQELHREPVEGTACGAGGVKGLSTQEAERTFLKIACQLDTYGVDPHPVKDHRGNQLYVGINHGGILTFQGGRKTNHFKWSEVNKINFEGRMFIVHLNYPEKKHTVGFKCPSGAACRHVWCCAIEQMLFFTLPSSSDACVYSGGGLFSWGTKFKYVGRTEREILERDGLLPPRDHSEGSSGGGRRKASSVPATPSTPMTGDFGYSSLPRSTHSAPLEESGVGGAGGAGEGEVCDGACLLSGAAVDIALACCDNTSTACPEYSRDAYEHSSTESAATHGTHGTHVSGLHGAQGVSGVSGAQEEWRAALQPPPRPFSLLRAFIPSFLFVWLSLALGALLLFETDWPLLQQLKRKPEIISLRHHYYTPLKEYLKKKVIELF